MVRENNSMLRAQRRDAYIGYAFKLIWWALILVILPYFTWLFIQPYLEGALQQYQAIQGQADQAQGAMQQLQELLKQVQGK